MVPSATDLGYFLACAELKSLSRAALQLDISQPSLTLAMQRLEQQLGETLFIRHQKGVGLTRAGTALLLQARQLLTQWEAVKTATQVALHQIQGHYRLGAHPSVALCALPRFLPAFLAKHPHFNLQLVHGLSLEITQQVLNLSVDVGIIVNPTKHADLVITPLADDKISLWQKGKSTTKTLKDFILLADPHLSQTQFILKQLRKKSLSPARLIHTCSLELIAELAASGAGVGILPESIAQTKKLQPVSGAPVYADEICVVYHGANRNVAGLQALVNAIKTGFIGQS